MKKNIQKIALIIMFLLLSPSLFAWIESPVFILDMDEVLVDRNLDASVLKQKTGEAEEIRIMLDGVESVFYLHPDFRPFLKYLKSIPNAKVYIYSAGSSLRNDTLLKKVIMFDHVSAYDFVDGVYNRENMTRDKVEMKALLWRYDMSFSELNGVKEIDKIPGVSEKNVIIVDDIPAFYRHKYFDNIISVPWLKLKAWKNNEFVKYKDRLKIIAGYIAEEMEYNSNGNIKVSDNIFEDKSDKYRIKGEKAMQSADTCSSTLLRIRSMMFPDNFLSRFSYYLGRR
jgi:hypothetical protein